MKNNLCFCIYFYIDSSDILLNFICRYCKNIRLQRDKKIQRSLIIMEIVGLISTNQIYLLIVMVDSGGIECSKTFLFAIHILSQKGWEMSRSTNIWEIMTLFGVTTLTAVLIEALYWSLTESPKQFNWCHV